MTFTLTRAPDNFSLMRLTPTPPTPADTTEYKCILVSCSLYVKVAQMTMPLYEGLEMKWKNEPLRYYYRKMEIKIESINSYSINHQTNNLFPDSTTPVKLYFAIVDTEALTGSYDKNPFCFIRKWEVAKSSQVTKNYAEDILQHELLRRVKDLEQQRNRQEKEQMEKNMELAFFNMWCKMNQPQMLQQSTPTPTAALAAMPQNASATTAVPTATVTTAGASTKGKRIPAKAGNAGVKNPTVKRTRVKAAQIPEVPQTDGNGSEEEEEEERSADEEATEHDKGFINDGPDPDYVPEGSEEEESEEESEAADYHSATSNPTAGPSKRLRCDIPQLPQDQNMLRAMEEYKKQFFGQKQMPQNIIKKQKPVPLPPRLTKRKMVEDDPDKDIIYVRSFEVDVASNPCDQVMKNDF